MSPSFKVSPHTHPESPITGSSVQALVDKAKKLGRTHFTYTDMGTLTAALTAYKLVEKAGMKFIPGLSIYFKDFDCPITKGTSSSKVKYFKTTLYAHNQEQFQKLCALASKNRLTVNSYGADIPLWDWSDLEEAGKIGLSLVTSDVHDLIFKNTITDRNELIVPTYNKLKSIFEDRISFAIIGSPHTRSHNQFVSIEFSDGTKDVLLGGSRVKTEVAHRAKASELVSGKHKTLIEGVKGLVLVKYGKTIKSAELIDGFIPLQEDIQLKNNKIAFALGQKLNVPVLYSDFAFYADKEDKIVQDVRLTGEGFRDPTLKHMQNDEEAREYLSSALGLDSSQIEAVFQNNSDWASSFDVKLKYDIRLPQVEGAKSSLETLLDYIQKGNRMPWGNKEYEDRLRKEINVLHKNGTTDLLPYFFPIIEIQNEEMKNGILVGPGRGSGAGALINYLTGITHVDPIKYDLSFERFLSLDRIKTGSFPDIDGDRGARDFLQASLEKKYGNKFAQISTRTLLRLKSSILDVNRFLNGKVQPQIETLSKSLPAAPQGVSDQQFVFGYEDSDGNYHPGLIDYNKDLQEYAKNRPYEWDIVKRCLGIARNMSVHASAFLIADKPIEDFIPVFSGTRVTQYEAKGAEAAGGIKYDFLVVSNLLDIQKCIELINKKNKKDYPTGYFDHEGEKIFVWDLPEDAEAFKSIWNGDTETCFQINTHSMVPYVKAIRPANIRELSDIIALVRPGTLDAIDENTGRNMAQEYVERKYGRSKGNIPELDQMLPETYGVVLYQEQSLKIAKELAGMDPVKAEGLRRALGKKLKIEVDAYKKEFIEGALKKVSEDVANKIWDQIEAGSRYSFNLSHSVSYAFIAYACVFLKHHYPLEWWTAVLTNADEKEITSKLYKHVKNLLQPPDINLSQNEMVIDYDRRQIRSKLTVLRGLGEKIADPIVQNRPYKDLRDFVQKEVAGPGLIKKLIHVGVMDSFFKPSDTLIDKLTEFDKVSKTLAYEKKIESGIKAKVPTNFIADPDYIGLHPVDDAKKKKAVLSTLPIRFSDIFAKHSKILNEGSERKPAFSDMKGRPIPLISGEELEELVPAVLDNWKDVCVAAYVVDCKEFSYAKGTKQAMKAILDVDGTQFELVMWPDFNTGSLFYPKEMKKGDVVLAFLKKRPGKPDISMTYIKIHP